MSAAAGVSAKVLGATSAKIPALDKALSTR
jgi:hypothetical protein